MADEVMGGLSSDPALSKQTATFKVKLSDKVGTIHVEIDSMFTIPCPFADIENATAWFAEGQRQVDQAQLAEFFQLKAELRARLAVEVEEVQRQREELRRQLDDLKRQEQAEQQAEAPDEPEQNDQEPDFEGAVRDEEIETQRQQEPEPTPEEVAQERDELPPNERRELPKRSRYVKPEDRVPGTESWFTADRYVLSTGKDKLELWEDGRQHADAVLTPADTAVWPANWLSRLKADGKKHDLGKPVRVWRKVKNKINPKNNHYWDDVFKLEVLHNE